MRRLSRWCAMLFVWAIVGRSPKLRQGGSSVTMLRLLEVTAGRLYARSWA